MTERLPAVRRSALDEPSAAVTHRANRDRGKAELEVYRYQLSAEIDRMKDLIDTDTLSDVFDAATEAELRFLREFRAKANGSQAAMEIVAGKLQMFDDITNRRLMRRFGR